MTEPTTESTATTEPSATTYEPEVETLLERFAAVGREVEEAGWLELPPMIEASLATARRGGLTNVCFDLGTCEDLVGTTLSMDDQRARQYGARYTPLSAARRAALARWHTELKDLRKGLLALVQRAANAARAQREEAERAQRARRRGW